MGEVPTIPGLEPDPGVMVRMACPFASSPDRDCCDRGAAADTRLSWVTEGRGPKPIHRDDRVTATTARPALTDSVDRIILTSLSAGSLSVG